MAYVLIDNSNTVVNVIVYDGTSKYTPPAGQSVLAAPDGTAIGDVYNGTSFSRPQTQGS